MKNHLPLDTPFSVILDISENTEVYVKIVDIALNNNDEELFYNTFKNKCHSAFIETAIDLWSYLEQTPINITDQNKFGDLIPYQESCSYCFYNLIVVPNGKVYHCCQPLVPICLGNINDENLVNLWNSKKRTQFLKALLTNGRKSIPICNNCAVAQNTIMSQEHDSLNGAQNNILKKMN